MSDAEVFIEGIRYVSTKAAAKRVGLSQNYVSKLCKSGFANARIIRGIWYIDEESFTTFLKQQAKERSRWQQRLSETRQAERSQSKSYPTGASAVTVHPRVLHEYHAARRKKKSMQMNIALASASLFIVALTATQLQLPSIGSITQYAAVNNAFISLESSFDSIRQSMNPQPKVIYVGVVSPTIVRDINDADGSAIITKAASDPRVEVQDNVQLAMNVQILQKDFVQKKNTYAYTLDFAHTPVESDIGQFVKSSDFGPSMSALVVVLSPAFHGSVYYISNEQDKTLTIYSTAKGTLSVILSAPRKDTGTVSEESLNTASSTAASATSTTEGKKSLKKAD